MESTTTSCAGRKDRAKSDKKHLRSELGRNRSIRDSRTSPWVELLSQEPSKCNFLADEPMYDANVMKQSHTGYLRTGPKRATHHQAPLQNSLAETQFNSRSSEHLPFTIPFISSESPNHERGGLSKSSASFDPKTHRSTPDVGRGLARWHGVGNITTWQRNISTQ